MDSESLIRIVNEAAALKISSLRRVYERNGFNVHPAHPIAGEVVNRLRQFAALSHARVQHLPTA